MPFTIEKERDSLYKDGLQKGEEKGILKGLEKLKAKEQKASKDTKITIAKALLKQGIDIEVIVESTGLSKKEVAKLIF